MPEETDFTDASQDIVNRVLSDVSTSFPATIVAPMPPTDGLVNVQPNHKFKTAVDDTELLPQIINNVVLVYPGRTQQTIIRPPKEALIGSKVLVLACEHSLTEWRSSSGASIYPEDGRQFDSNDAIAIMGLYPETMPWPNPQLPATFEMLGTEGVKFKMGTQTADLPGLAYQILLLMSAGVDPVVGPTHGQFINLAQITPLIVKLLTIVHPQVA